jgi:hypothetical protein
MAPKNSLDLAAYPGGNEHSERLYRSYLLVTIGELSKLVQPQKGILTTKREQNHTF